MPVKSKLLYQGAEALLIKEDNKLIKRRVKKSYRIPEIDIPLRKQRTKKEAKLLEKLQNLIPVPRIIKVNQQENEIVMQHIKGKKLSEHLDKLKNKNQIMQQVGKTIAILHNNNIIHGDLTTSNMILVENPINKSIKNNKSRNIASELVGNLKISNKIKKGGKFKVYLIDFGLSFHSTRIEDKAVDLHLLKQSLEAKHFENFRKLFSSLLQGYNPENKVLILQQLKKVESRGRYKG